MKKYFLSLIFSFLFCFAEIATAQVIVFVSSSMPKNLLEQYSIQAKKYDALIVMRGLKNNSFQDSMEFILDTNKDLQIQINEEFFENFAVTIVPSIVLVTTKGFDKVVGSLSIQAALELMAKQGELSIEAQKILEEKK